MILRFAETEFHAFLHLILKAYSYRLANLTVNFFTRESIFLTWCSSAKSKAVLKIQSHFILMKY